MSPLIIGIAIVLIAGIALIIVSMMRPAQTDVIGDRLSQFTERTMTLDELELQQPFSQRVLVPLTRTILAQLCKYGPKQSAERLRLNLQQAGNPGNMTPVMFSGLRMALFVLLLVTALVLAEVLALLNCGITIAARMPRMITTIRISIRVKPLRGRRRLMDRFLREKNAPGQTRRDASCRSSRRSQPSDAARFISRV